MPPVLLSLIHFALALALLIMASHATGIGPLLRFAAVGTAVMAVVVAVMALKIPPLDPIRSALLEERQKAIDARQRVIDSTQTEMDQLTLELASNPGATRLAEIKRQLDTIKQTLDGLKW